MSFVVSEILAKKRDKEILSAEEITFLIKGISSNDIPDYQASAFLMASFLNGLNNQETVELTRAMKDSGRVLRWRELNPNFESHTLVDKHSTGGVGDKVSIVLAPLAKAMGLTVPMMSGRGLGHTGGTIDKLESIAGFNCYPGHQEMLNMLLKSGICMMAQAKDLCPADAKLYALRGVTATVESIPLITASIVSKKWAEGVDNLVFDVKCGSAAFMPTLEDARSLAQSLVSASQGAGLNAMACITRMEEPLGYAIGNALEIKECICILKNEYQTQVHKKLALPLKNLILHLCAKMKEISDPETGYEKSLNLAQEQLNSGSAWNAFEEMLKLQGAKADYTNHFATAKKTFELKSTSNGIIKNIHSRGFGLAGIKVAMGRKQTDDVIDAAVGFEMMCRPFDNVAEGDCLMIAHLQNEEQWQEVKSDLLACFEWSEYSDETYNENLVIEELH